MIEYTIPGPPVGKERPRVVSGGIAYTPAKTRRYEAAAGLLARAAVTRRKGWDVASFYAVTLEVCFPDARKRDLDNVIKSVLDSGNGILWSDDARVVEIHARSRIDRANPRVEVGVRDLFPEEGGGEK